MPDHVADVELHHVAIDIELVGTDEVRLKQLAVVAPVVYRKGARVPDEVENESHV